MNKKTIVILVGLFLIAALLLVWQKTIKKKPVKSINNGSEKSQDYTGPRYTTTLKVSKDGGNLIPPGMTEDMILESGIKTLESKTTTDTKTSTNQSIYSYRTSKTIQDNYNSYKQNFASRGWVILTTVDKKDFKEIKFNTGNGILDVSFNYQNNAGHLVTLTYTYKP